MNKKIAVGVAGSVIALALLLAAIYFFLPMLFKGLKDEATSVDQTADIEEDDCVGGSISDDGLFIDCPDPEYDRDNTPEEEEVVLETGRKLLADLKRIRAGVDLALTECNLAEIDRLGDEYAEDWNPRFDEWGPMAESAEAADIYRDINDFLKSNGDDSRGMRLDECKNQAGVN